MRRSSGLCCAWLVLVLPAAAAIHLSVLSWNVHWQCGADRIPGCRAAAIERIVNLSARASVVVSIELERNGTSPVDLTEHGLAGWTQFAGSCAPASPGHTGDVLSVSLAPGYRLQAADGGCLGGPDSRAFAVGLVQPPEPVRGCPAGICVIGLHAPHGRIGTGSQAVAAVCGHARGCTVAAGDWNAPADSGVPALWEELVGEPGNLTVVAPNKNSCCYPDTKYRGADDHLATDIPGAALARAAVLPYQMKMSNDTEEHKPILVELNLPASCEHPPCVSVPQCEHGTTNLSIAALADGSGKFPARTVAELCYTRSGLTVLYHAMDEKLFLNRYRQDNADMWNNEVVEVFVTPDQGRMPTRYLEVELSPNDNVYIASILNPYGNGTSKSNVLVDVPHAGVSHNRQLDRPAGIWRSQLTIPWSLVLGVAVDSPVTALPTRWRMNLFRVLMRDPKAKVCDDAVCWYGAWSPTGASPSNYHVTTAMGTMLLV